MAAISEATASPVAWDRSKTLKLPDDFYRPEPEDSGYARYLRHVLGGAPLVVDNTVAALSDDSCQQEPQNGEYATFLQAERTGIPLTSDNRPDNIWGRISLPNGDTAIIYNKGGVETDHTMLDIDWNVDGEAARAEAIIARYGGVLEIAETADPKAPRTAVPDAATLLSNIMDSPALVERMFGIPETQLLPEGWMSGEGAE